MQMSNQKRNEIVKDLVTKFPKGPHGLFKKKHYHMSNQWHDIYERYTDVPVLWLNGEETPHFGYNPVDLFSLKIEDMNDCYDAVRLAFSDDDISRRALVRRARVLWYRVRPAYRQVLKSGATGVYELKWGWRYNSPRAYVHASTHEEAQAVGLTLNGIFGAPIGEKATTTFLEVGEPVATLAHNNQVAQKLVKNAEKELRNAEEALAKAQAGIKDAKARAEIIMTNAMMQANLHEEASVG